MAWNWAGKLAGFFDVQNFTALVVAALGAGAMRHLLLMAIGALRERVSLQGVVRTSGTGARLGMSAFRVWHESSSLKQPALAGPAESYCSNFFLMSFNAAQRGSCSLAEHEH